MKKIPFILIILFYSLGAYNERPNNLTKSFGLEYFPLKKNSTYKYDSNLGNTTAKTKSEGKGIKLSYDSGNITYQQNLYADSTGIYLTKVENKALFWGNKVTYSKPVLRIPFPVKVGDTWYWEGYEHHENGEKTKMTLKGKMVSEEVISTRAGKFNCIKITLEIKSENGSSNTTTEWLAPGIGIVKFHAVMQGKGIAWVVQKMMGLKEVEFSLAEMKDKK